MLNIKLDKNNSIAVLEPDGELTEADFINAAKIIDPYLEESNQLNGLIIHTQSFPGWDSFSVFISHFKFVKDHHKKISHVAIVTDSPLGTLAENITSHFVSAEIKHFSYSEYDNAVKWIKT